MGRVVRNGSYLTNGPKKITFGALVFDIVTSVTSEVFDFRLVNTGNYDFTVDWGDGSKNRVKEIGTGNDISHTYAVAGTYVININGIAQGLNFNGNQQIRNFYSFGKIDLKLIIFRNSSLRKLPQEAGAFAGVLNDISGAEKNDGAFSSCVNLINLPSRIFEGNIALTDVSFAFSDCSSLTYIDPSTFHNTNITAYDNVFVGCTPINESELPIEWF